jgi:hypothetical protein
LVNSCYLSQRDEKADRYLRILLKEYPAEANSLSIDLKKRIADVTVPAENVLPVPAVNQLPPLDSRVVVLKQENVPENVIKPAIGALPPGQPIAAALPEPHEPETQLLPRPENIADRQSTSSMATPASPEQVPVAPPVATAVNPLPLAASVPETKNYYFLTAGESTNRKIFEPVVKTLESAGIKPLVAETTRDLDVFRLVLDCSGDRKPVEQKRVQVAHQIKDAFIAKVGESFCVVVGSFLFEESAKKEQNKLAAEGLEGLNIVKNRIQQKVWRVTAGRYADMTEAEQSVHALLRRGINVSIMKSEN